MTWKNQTPKTYILKETEMKKNEIEQKEAKRPCGCKGCPHLKKEKDKFYCTCPYREKDGECQLGCQRDLGENNLPKQ
jgi:hypothetical protein